MDDLAKYLHITKMRSDPSEPGSIILKLKFDKSPFGIIENTKKRELSLPTLRLGRFSIDDPKMEKN
jgi:hypothetical protein